MGVSETAKLAVDLTLGGNFNAGIASAERGLSGLSTSASRTSAGLSKIGQGLALGVKSIAIAGAAAMTVLVGIEGRGLRSLTELDALNAQTAAALKSTGYAAGVSAKQITDWSQALSDANAVDEMAIQHVENLLLTFRNIKGDTFPKATQAVLDMSRALGIDAAGAAIQLGKALDNPTLGLTALRRVGVSFTDQQVTQIKTLMKGNDVLGAQKIILDEINKEFGGSGAAFSETTAGKIQKVTDKFDELARTLALASLPALNAIADGLNSMLGSREFMQGAADLGKSIAGIFSPANVSGAIKFARDVLPPIGAALKALLDIASKAISLFNSLPAELKTVAIAALIGNKLTGGLVASGVGDIAKGLLSGGASAAAGGSGGLAATLGSTILKVSLVAIAAGVAAQLAGALGQQSTDLQSLGNDIVAAEKRAGTVMTADQIRAQMAQIASNSGMSADGTQVKDPLSAIALYVTNPLNHGLDNLNGAYMDLQSQLKQLHADIKDADQMGGPNPNTGRGIAQGIASAVSDTMNTLRGQDIAGGIAKAVGDTLKILQRPLDVLHLDFQKQLAILHKTADPSAAAKAAARIAKDVLKGAGSADNTKALLATLQKDRGLVASSGDKKLLAQIDRAIADVKGKIPGREWVQKQLTAADKIARSSLTANQKADQLKAIQRTLLSHGDTAAARQVGQLQKIAAKKTTITVNTTTNVSTSVSVRNVNQAISTRARYQGRGGYTIQ